MRRLLLQEVLKKPLNAYYLRKSIQMFNQKKSLKGNIMKTVKLSTVVTNLIAVIGFVYLVYALLCAFTGTPVFSWTPIGEGMVFASVAMAAVKGAEKVSRLPFDIAEAMTKSGKACLAVSFPRTEKGELALQTVNDLLYFANGQKAFAWPSQNPDKVKFITVGVWPNNKEILLNYASMTTKTAREIGEASAKERKAEREAKKANKGEGKKAMTAAIAKVQAIQDMVKDGLITPEAGLEAIGKIS
jgi:hypothetical protein